MPRTHGATPQYRGVVMARGGMVASSHPLASAAGLHILRSGGNAADAAVATAAACGVVLSGQCGLGGDMFCLYYDVATRTLTGFNGSGVAGSGATIDELRRRGHDYVPARGPLSVTVPGAVHGYYELHSRFGSLPWARLFDDAIRYAEQGHPYHQDIHTYVARTVPQIQHETEWTRVYMPAGQLPRPGEFLVLSDLAWSLRQVADGGRDAFYRGEIARRIAATLAERGGFIAEADLAAHTTEVYTPLSTTYRGLTVHETQPPSQGFLVLEMLNLLEGFDLAAMGFGSAAAIHHMVEAKKLAFADRWAYMGDPRFVEVPTAELIGKAYAAARRRALNPERASDDVPAGALSTAAPASTTYFCVVDGDGNAASFIHTLFSGMGSGVTVPGTGIVLTNRGSAFVLDEHHPNRLEPGKRPMHTLNCYVVTDGDELVLVGGTPGADSQPQWNVQTLTNLFDFGMNVQQAVEAPSWVSIPGTDPRTWNAPYELQLEAGFAPDTIAGLERLGHRVRRFERLELGGNVQLIRRDPATGVLHGGSDPRADGCAVGF